MTKVTRKTVFDRIDRNQDGELDRGELKQLGKEAEVGTGLLGGLKLKGAVDATMDSFDQDGDGKITLEEFLREAKILLPAGLEIDPDKARAEPDHVRERVASYLDLLTGNNPDAGIDRAALERKIKTELDKDGVLLSGLMAEVAAKIGMKTLDGDGDGRIDQEELESFAADVVADSDDED